MSCKQYCRNCINCPGTKNQDCKQNCKTCANCYYGNQYHLGYTITNTKPLFYNSYEGINGINNSGVTYQIPRYPPLVYYHHNPETVIDKCGYDIANKYNKQLELYRMCQKCKQDQYCYDPINNQCIKCSYKELNKSCEEKFGCKHPNSQIYQNVAPVNPRFNGCKMCWN